MKAIFVKLVFGSVFFSDLVIADCYGLNPPAACAPLNKNEYNAEKNGNKTTYYGYNTVTGLSWKQTNTEIGNSTYIEGIADDGSSWSSSQTRIGASTFIIGKDPHGNSYSMTCNKFRCY